MEENTSEAGALKSWVVGVVVAALMAAGLAGVWFGTDRAQAQPAITHPVEGRSDCLLCHGQGKVRPVPQSHSVFTNATCLGCHQVGGAATATPSPAATSAPTPTPPPDTPVTPPQTITPGLTPTPQPTSTAVPQPTSIPQPTFTPGPTPTPRPVSGSQLNDSCLACHENKDLSITLSSGEKFSLFVDRDRFAGSIHGDKLLCTDCHSNIQAFPHPERKFATTREYTLAEYELCKRCHFANYTKTLDGIHYNALTEGVANAPVCVDCHDSHYVSRPDQPRTAISQTCSQCHAKIYNDYSRSVHGEALIDANNKDVPVCTTCHGVHNIVNPTTVQFRYDIPQLCGSCHGDPKLMNKYGLSTQVMTTYLRDFHGVTFSLRKQQTPDIRSYEPACTDCHGTHNILKPDSAASPVMKENLVKTCRQCHTDASPNFSSAWMGHYAPSPTRNPLVYWLSAFYRYFMIPFIVGGLVIHILLDLWRVANRR